MKPVKIDLPYPSIECILPDPRIARIISYAFCSPHGELTATLQYIYHYFNFNGLIDKNTANKIMGIAVAEMEHFEILGKLLVKLGADPIFTRFPPRQVDFYSTRALSYSKTPVKMLLDDISGEMVAISEYKKIACEIDDEKVSAVIARIILDEELHVAVLKDLLKKYSDSCEF